MIIAIDFDDVTADFFTSYLLFLNRQRGTSYTKDHMVTAGYPRITDIQEDEWLRDVHGFIEHYSVELVSPMAHAQEMLQRLSRKHQLHTVTSRSRRFSEMTMRWKRLHGVEHCFTAVHFCGNEAGDGNHREKNEVCRDIGAELFIDDHPRNAAICASDGIKALIFDQPWNRHAQDAPNVRRIHSWKDEVILTLCD